MFKIKIILLFVAVAVSTAFGFVNCSSQFGSAADFSTPPNNGLMSSSPRHESVLPADLNQPVGTFCSDSATAAMGGTNITLATQINAVFLDSSGTVLCNITDQPIRAGIINEQTVQINNIQTECPTLAAGTYQLSLVANNSKSDLLWGQDVQDVFNDRTNYYAGNIVPLNAIVTEDSSGDMTVTTAPVTGGLPTVLLNSNISGGGSVLSNPTAGATTVTGTTTTTCLNSDGVASVCPGGDPNGTGSSCDASASPLLVQINPGSSTPQAIELLPPLSGIQFDILGENSSPTPHTKKLISWFTSATVHGNYYIVLPNSQGQVLGIDQLFGNNTRGPDGTFAANGYEALRKWDGRLPDGSFSSAARDGVINHSDAVFSQLRLWEDVNGDGIAQASELHTLDQLGVQSISLGYNANFQERDKYGNEIRYKSAVTTSDGLNHVMYDIWFRLVAP